MRFEVPEAKGEILRRCVKTTKVNVRGLSKMCEKNVKSDFFENYFGKVMEKQQPFGSLS